MSWNWKWKINHFFIKKIRNIYNFLPSVFWAFKLALFWMRYSTIGAWPYSAAVIRGVFPLHKNQWITGLLLSVWACRCFPPKFGLNWQAWQVWNLCLVVLLIYPLDSRNTKKPKTKTADFFVNTRISVKFFQKKPK